jgi:hypothetical protein
VLNGDSYRAHLALAHGRGHAEGARDAERFADVEHVARDGAYDEVHVDWIDCRRWRRALIRAGYGRD